MAKNKRDIDLDVKKKALEETAARLFMTCGYEATSMSRIAQELGVTPNTLYWYYASKDELLVGVLNRLLSDSLKQLPPIMGSSPKEQISWALQEFEQSRALVNTVHGKLSQSALIRDWHERFHRALESAVVHTLKAKGISTEQARILATVATFLVEGLLAHPHTEKQRDDILEWFGQNALPDPA
ncbi:TetR family transcriptional regulator [Alcanivorax balearicus MACL04]|uniref:TetR family transcriptional regulator n=1 Tax=Alloalcanivorax balearicus MACL04 TaxID=1177182 RepID=A0ABT2R495_9GAMM|nr:TetR/AcrR family transcriptional regulator [Alloalcanivorax balearicus]MCU5784601.1 TetR family transcriptional regulator [Alloalcanivorax balearicus MACL04]